jgi:lysophospholipid acyltransferase (LPLAT)-like uncharacterized protein
MAAQIVGLRYNSPLPFTARQRVLLNLGAPLIAAGVKLLSSTCRHELRGLEFWESIQRTDGRAIVAVWHESTTLAAYHYRNTGFHTLASYSFDAECGVRALERLGIFSVRGSSSRGGSEALRDLAVALERAGTVLLTLDGPRGPRRMAKPGAAILAARTGASIIPHAFAVSPAWRLRSWDRLSIAKPFARVISAYAPPIPPPANMSPAAIDETRLQLEASLNQVHQQLEALLGIENGTPGYEREEPAYAGTSSNR